MKRLCCFALAIALGSVAGSRSSLRAAETEVAAGRELAMRYADAIVSVELVVTLRIKMGDREAPPRERRIEVNGTVISPDGLTVTSLTSVDPQSEYDSYRAAQPGARGAELVGADFKEVKLRFADGKEVPARFILKDADLDLAFMAPEATADKPAAAAFSFVKLENAAKGGMLDTFYYVSRAPKTLQRVPMVRRSEVMGIIEKPRRFYLLTEQSLGTPVFDAQGKVLGITLTYLANGQRAGFVVLPAEDIAEMAKQASAAQTSSGKSGN